METLILKPDKERTVRFRHPWIYSGALLKPVKNAGYAQLSDGKGRILASGFAEPDASLALRIVHWGPANLSSESFWRQRFERAIALRRRWLDNSSTNCWRMIHGEADFIPGLVVDVYDKCIVMQSGWAGAEGCIPVWTSILRKIGFRNILRKRTGANKPGAWQEPEGVLSGEIPDRIAILENGIRYELDPRKGQKTGFFLDQRDNRALLRSLSSGCRVLNAFCYTGGFSLSAAFGKASEVVSLDISRPALEELEANWQLNRLQTPHLAVCADAFQWMREAAPDSFDAVVLDPPAFATSKASLDRAARGYKDILMQGCRLTRDNGLIMIYSCSQHVSNDLLQKIAFGAVLDSGVEAQALRRLGAGADHPFSLYHPEGEYLKGLLLRIGKP